MSAIVTLNQFVSNLMLDMDAVDDKDKAKIKTATIRELKRLNISTIQNVLTKKFPISGTNSVILPDDFVRVSKVGYCCGDRFICLGLTDNPCFGLPEEDKCDCEEAKKRIKAAISCEKSKCKDLSMCDGHHRFHNCNNLGEMYAYSAGINYPGCYKIARQGMKCIIHLDPNLDFSRDGEIVVEYISSGDKGQLQAIPIEYEEYLEHKVMYKYNLHKGNLGASDRNLNRFKEIQTYQLRALNDTTIDQWIDALTCHVKSSL